MFRKFGPVVLFLAAALLIAACSQITAAGQVTGQRLIDTIVKQVGELEVKRQEVANAIQGARDEIERLKSVKIENAVQAELLRTQVADMEGELQGMQIEMDKLADYIDAGRPLQLSDGTEVSVEQLQQYADDLITNFDTLQQTLVAKQQALALHEENIRLADERTGEGISVVRHLESQLEVIDAQIETLRVFSERPELLVDAGEDKISSAQQIVSETSAILSAQIAAWKAEVPSVSQTGGDISDALRGEGSPATTVDNLRRRAGTDNEPAASPTATPIP